MDEETVRFLEVTAPSNFDFLVDVFKANYIDFETLLTLTEKDLEKFLPQVGLQKKILSALDVLSKSLKDTDSKEEQDSLFQLNLQQRQETLEVQEKSTLNPSNRKRRNTAANSTKNSKLRKPEFELNHSDTQNSARRYLDANIQGQKILALYKKGLFDSCVRSQLAEVIIVSELNIDLDTNKVISSQRFVELADEIVQVFPTEITATYYIPRKPRTILEGAKQPKGKLYDKYTTIIKGLRASGLRYKDSETSIPDGDPLNITNEQRGEINGDLSWLRRCIEPEIEASERWTRTTIVRLQALRITPTRKKGTRKQIDSITEYMNEYRVLRQPWGYRLLQIDYNNLYGTTELKLIEDWQNIAIKIKCLAGEQLTFTDTLEDTVKTLKLIPRLFKTVNVRKWKTTVNDTENGFLLHVKVQSDLEAEVQRMRDKLEVAGSTQQPFPVIVGSTLSSITDSYVYIDTFFYRVDSPLRAIDVCFKAYHALHAFYPHQSVYPWLFVQKAIYGVVTQWDPEVPSVETKVNEFRQLSIHIAAEND